MTTNKDYNRQQGLKGSGVKPRILMLIGCLLVLMLMAVSHMHSVLNTQALQTVRANKAQIDRLDELMLLVVDAETSVRGYLLTLSKPYLEPFLHSQKRFNSLLAELAADFPEQSPHHQDYLALQDLVTAKRAYLAKAVEIGKVIQTVEDGNSGAGKQMMDQIRSAILVLKTQKNVINEALEAEAAELVKKAQWVMYLMAAGSFALILALFLVQQRQSALRTRMNVQLESENNRLERMVTQRTSELTDLASYLTNARETERARLAREMHDELGALLTAAKMDASWLLRSLGGTLDPSIKDRFRRLIDNLGSGISVKRRIIDDLCPPLLQGLGLVEALRALVDTFDHEVTVRAELPEAPLNPSEAQSLALFRIAQEALTNIRKYAKASEITLRLTVEGQQIVLSVTDNGKGFDPQKTTIKRHGLAGMKHRAQMFNGILSVESSPGLGTQVEARMPLVEPDEPATMA